MSSEQETKAKVFVKYPISSLLIYNGATILHYVLGGVGIVIGYGNTLAATLGGVFYFLFAFIQMYILMPLMVCPHCVYYRLDNSLCISGMNLFSRKLAKQGDLESFPNRGKGILCHNNLYMASLVIPIPAMIAAMLINFTYTLLAVFIGVLVLLLFRIMVIFPKIACIHCSAKKTCPNAQSMGLSDS